MNYCQALFSLFFFFNACNLSELIACHVPIWSRTSVLVFNVIECLNDLSVGGQTTHLMGLWRRGLLYRRFRQWLSQGLSGPADGVGFVWQPRFPLTKTTYGSLKPYPRCVICRRLPGPKVFFWGGVEYNTTQAKSWCWKLIQFHFFG